jgi:tRNA(Arg) A34 adenosine deaminase TadA
VESGPGVVVAEVGVGMLIAGDAASVGAVGGDDRDAGEPAAHAQVVVARTATIHLHPARFATWVIERCS